MYLLIYLFVTFDAPFIIQNVFPRVLGNKGKLTGGTHTPTQGYREVRVPASQRDTLGLTKPPHEQ